MTGYTTLTVDQQRAHLTGRLLELEQIHWATTVRLHETTADPAGLPDAAAAASADLDSIDARLAVVHDLLDALPDTPAPDDVHLEA